MGFRYGTLNLNDILTSSLLKLLTWWWCIPSDTPLNMILLAYSYHIPIISNISENEQILITKTTIDLAAASNLWFVLYQ